MDIKDAIELITQKINKLEKCGASGVIQDINDLKHIRVILRICKMMIELMLDEVDTSNIDYCSATITSYDAKEEYGSETPYIIKESDCECDHCGDCLYNYFYNKARNQLNNKKE